VCGVKLLWVCEMERKGDAEYKWLPGGCERGVANESDRDVDLTGVGTGTPAPKG
jgi:hypothetical protein